MVTPYPFTWKPSDIVTVTNKSDENLLLELASGPLRLDIGVTRRVTASALQQPRVKALVEAGKLSVEKARRK